MTFSKWWIVVSFSYCPRRCCFSLAHAAQASMARFYFHDIPFLCRKSTAQKLPSQLFANARTSIAAPARTQAYLLGENFMIKHAYLDQNNGSSQGMVAEFYWVNWLAYTQFPSLVFSWSSPCLSARASLFFSTGGSCAANYCDALQKGKGHLLQPVKPWSDQNTALDSLSLQS